MAQTELEQTEASVGAPLPLAVRVATGDGGPDRVYRFRRDVLYDPRHIIMFQHIEGATYCEVREERHQPLATLQRSVVALHCF